jgi:hypothetical protein
MVPALAVPLPSRIFPHDMRLFRRLGIVALLLASALVAPARASWLEREEIPVESPVYRWLDELATSYPLSRGLLLVRPWTRGDLGRFLDQLVEDAPTAANDPVVARLRLELAPAGGFDGLEPMLTVEEDDAALEVSGYARSSYAEDRARGTVARDHRLGLQASVALGRGGLLFADGYAGNVTPGPHGTPDATGSFLATTSDLTAWFDRAYASWRSPGFTVRAGRTWLSWGPGLAGTLALSDGAPALDAAEASVRLPGGGQLHWFVATLDAAGQRYLAGHRLAVRAGPSVELGFSELARFDGSGSLPLYVVPVVPYALLDRLVRGETDQPAFDTTTRNNVLYSTDFSWTWRPGVRLYGEFMVDDLTFDGSRPLAVGWQAGAQLRRRLAGTAWSLRGDYTRVYRYVYSVYRGQDFSHAGFPTGFPLGPDVDQFVARLECRPDPAWAIGVDALAVRKGAQPLGLAWQPGTEVPARPVLVWPVEQDQRVALTAEWSPSASFSVSAAGGLARLRTLDHVPGRDTHGAIGRGAVTVRW